MANFLYANTHSIFDYTNGISKSIKLILENLVKLGNSVYVITGCTSFSEEGFNESIKAWDQANKQQFMYQKSGSIRFNQNGVNYSLIRTKFGPSLKLQIWEQEYIYREVIRILDTKEIEVCICWGSHLLEESIFKEAEHRKINTCYYLTNPNMKGKDNYLLKNANHIWTDSQATKKLYEDDLKSNFMVIPKFIEEPKEKMEEIKSSFLIKKCLFVNPTLYKGFEAFIEISNYFTKTKNDIRFICVDSRSQLKKSLTDLKITLNQLPSNIDIKAATKHTDKLFRGISILLLPSLWHESGSRLIYEAYSRGIPVIAFNTGGTSEMMNHFKEDIFSPPNIKLENGIIRVINWSPDSLCKRIQDLLKDKDLYDQYSKKIKKNYDDLNLASKCDQALKEITNLLIKNNQE